MTTAPSDLLSLRTRGMAITGVVGNAFGVAPDPSHLAGGGYHVGVQDIKKIGKWTGSNVDYSVKLGRDRSVDGTNNASAADWGGPWPIGGQAAWLRWNNALVAAKRANHPALAALRAINFTPDGSSRKRYDGEHPGDGVINSNDTVTVHTHLEWYRDTIGHREPSFQFMLDLAGAAIRNDIMIGDDMSNQAENILAALANGGKTYIGSDGQQHEMVFTTEIYRQIEFRNKVLALLGGGVTLAPETIDALASALASHTVTGAADEAAVKAALEEILPNVELTFRPTSA